MIDKTFQGHEVKKNPPKDKQAPSLGHGPEVLEVKQEVLRSDFATLRNRVGRLLRHDEPDRVRDAVGRLGDA